MGIDVRLAVVSRRRRQREARKQLNFESGHKRAAEYLKGVTDARMIEKAIKVREHYRSHALRPEHYKYEPKLPMDRTSKEFQVKQRENWILVTNRRFKELGMRLDDTRGESSSSNAKPKRSHRRRGGL